MAGSRLEKIGTIFTRTTGLLRSGALNWEDRPLWYDVYAAFPPYDEPRFDRPAPNTPLKHIFYKEDIERAKRVTTTPFSLYSESRKPDDQSQHQSKINTESRES